MNPAPNPFQTLLIAAPPTMPDCLPIEATVSLDPTQGNYPVISTAWEPTDEEIAAIVRGAKIFVNVYCNALPPLSLSVGAPPDHLTPVKLERKSP